MFDADVILEKQKQKTTHEFVLDQLDLPEGMDPPVLKIKVTQDIKTRAKAAKRRHNNIEGGFDGGRAVWKPVDEPEKYLEFVLNLCFEAIEGLFEPGTPAEKAKRAFLALVTDKEKTAKYLASLLMHFFDGEEEETDEKN